MNSRLFNQGDWVWVSPSTSGEFDVPYAGKIIKLDRNRILLMNDNGQETWIKAADIMKAIHATSFKYVEDMISLGDLQEYSILRNLQLRYREKKIYVRIFFSVFIVRTLY